MSGSIILGHAGVDQSAIFLSVFGRNILALYMDKYIVNVYPAVGKSEHN